MYGSSEFMKSLKHRQIQAALVIVSLLCALFVSTVNAENKVTNNSSKTDSIYAVQDEEKEKGYFSRK